MKRKWLRWAGWAVVVLTAVFFIVNGLQKIAGTETMRAMFDEFGFADWARVTVGIAELAGGIGLLIRPLTGFAAAGLAVLMAGAAGTELTHGHQFEALIPAQWLIVLAVIAVIRLRRRSAPELEGANPARQG